MLSGRYRCEQLRKHWTKNKLGLCELPPCYTLGLAGSLEHQLLWCEGLAETRSGLLDLWKTKLAPLPHILDIVQFYTITQPEQRMQFLLDASILPKIINLIQLREEEGLQVIFQLTRTFCSALHKMKMKLLGII